MNKKQLIVCVGALVAGLGFQASAQISGLYNTGVDNSGTPLANGTIGDPHYLLVNSPYGAFPIQVENSSVGFPIPPYLGDDSLSSWIGPVGAYYDGASFASGPPGEYDYQTTFTAGSSLEGISGQVSSDNEFLDILLNGQPLGISNLDPGNFSYWTPFTIGTGFEVTGVNTLDFIVYNDDPGATAFRAEFSAPDSSFTLGIATPVWGMTLWAATLLRRKKRS